MNELKAQYLSMAPIKDINWKNNIPEWGVFGPSDQLHLLKTTIYHPVGVLHCPSISYRRFFLKYIITQLEKAYVEICDELYEVYTELLSENSESDTCFKSYILPDGDFVSLQESTKLISQGTTGLNTWQAALHLAEWANENRLCFQNRNILELGSGLGLTGLSVCKQCSPRELIFSDCHTQVISQLLSNIKLNLNKTHSITNSTESISEEKVKNCYSKHSGMPQNVPVAKKEDISVPNSSGDMKPESLSLIKGTLCIEEGQETTMKTSGQHYCDFGRNVGSLESASGICPPPIGIFLPNGWGCDDSLDSIPIFSDSSLPCVKVAQLDWQHAQDSDLLGLSTNVDIVIAADVVYDLSIIPSLIRVLKLVLLTPKSSIVPRTAIVASTIRNEETSTAFKLQLESAKLTFSKLTPPSQPHFYYDRSMPIEILQIQAME